MYEDLWKTLTAASPGLDAESLRDVLWLARRVPTGPAAPLVRRRDRPQAAGGGPPAPGGSGTDEEAPARGPGPPLPSLHAGDPHGGTTGGPGPGGGQDPRGVTLPAPRTLPHTRALGRALRPLGRRATGRDPVELDEAATADAIARTGALLPVLRPAPEPRWRLAFVADHSGRPELWERSADEFYGLLRRTGAFRETRRHRTHHPAARVPGLGPADGRTVTLLMTDGLGQAWRDAAPGPLLGRPARSGPTALIHALPPRLWPQTALAAEHADITPALDRHLPPPVVALLPAALADWTRAVTRAPGPTPLRLWTGPSGHDPSWPDTLHQLSPEAHLLAAHLAARDDLTVPVMQLVNGYVNGTSDLAQIAELAVTGVLVPASGARRGSYLLAPDARRDLLGTVPLSEYLACARHITDRLRSLAGRSPRFPAWLAPPAEDGPAPLAWAPEPLRRALGLPEPGAPAAQAAATAPTAPVSSVASAVPAMSAAPIAPADGSAARGARRPYFFFSYARRDHLAGGAFVDQFFTDLRDELARIAPEAGPGELAYRDTERLRVGDDWERQLSRMVGASRTMVALYSPAYFANVYCGKEWTAFDLRTRRHEEQTGESVPALIPVLWEPLPDDLPAEVRQTHSLQDDFGAGYATGGLRHLLRTDPHGAAYRSVVRRVAERVREAAARRVAELRDLDLGRVDGFFPVPEMVAAAGRGSLVRLFVAAGRASEDTGSGGGRYGTHAWDWAPYHPPAVPSLVVQAQQVLTRAGHSTSVEEIAPGLGEALDRARENNEVSVLLVDPWAAGREPYRQALRDFDRQNHPVTVVLLPDSSDDPPSGPARARLWEGVREVFARTWLHRSGPEPLFRVHVRRERFERELLSTVTAAQNRLLDGLDTERSEGPGADFGLRPGWATMPGLVRPAEPSVPGRDPSMPARPAAPARDPSEIDSR
ncbi:TIR-like protein FxsC [Kitasatospora sp. NPDC056184]|uniref:TIR-like protein FxsC n=1 Tax=Kitasatospora sp. NPDC056184 TaxID=3345738 RepID=UPI0035D75455